MKRSRWAGRLGASLCLAMVLGAVPATGITLTHPGYLEPSKTPEETSSITQVQDPTRYQAGDCTLCHTAQGGSVDNNHGLYLRPITSQTPSVSSNNPFWPQLPGSAAFSFTPGAFNRADWIIGGLGIGAERYIYDSTMSVGPETATYPRLGNLQWLMDFGGTIRRGDPLLGTNGQSAEATAWKSYSGGSLNYFTGTTALAETVNDYGCVRCHSYGSKITIDAGTGVPSYTIDEWGVTCANCHKPTQSAAHGFNPRYTSDKCNDCHQRNPVPASIDTSGRAEQLDMFIWDSGQARNHRNQGYEINKPRISATPVAGAVETSGGAGHYNSWNVIKSFAQRKCMRCHTTEGYIAHTTNGTDTPYFWTAATGFDFQKQYAVDPATATGVSCVACHTTHGSEVGLNQFGNRSTGLNQCADCHRESNSLLPAEGTFDYNMTRISHPQREIMLGYGGYGVSADNSVHEMEGVWCQYCHMPVAVGTPESDRSHLFKIIMPEKTKSGVTVGFVRYPAGATTTTPVPQTPSALPDDSCTGSDCHAATDAVKTSLQNVIVYRQSTTMALLDSANQKMTEASYASNLPAWKMARINVWMVEQDKSLGIHNYYYTKGLLDHAISTFEGILNGVSITTVSISASTLTPAYGGSVTISGVLRDRNLAPVPGRTLVLQKSADGVSWINVGPVGSSTGTYSTIVKPTTRTFYRWVFEGDASFIMSSSSSVIVKPSAYVSRPTAHSSWLLGTRHMVSGYLKPLHAAGAKNVVLRFYRKEGSVWVLRKSVSAVNSNYLTYSRYSATTSMSLRGSWRVRGTYAATATNSAATSGYFYFTVK